MKKIILSLIFISSLVHAAHYKSTQEAIADIYNAYNALLQTNNLFDPRVSFKEITDVSDTLNKYIMSKQGILLGKTSPRKGIFRKPSGEDDNIFDLWEIDTYPFFNLDIMNALKTIRLTKGKDTQSITLIKTVNTNRAPQNLILRAKEIRSKTILDEKKKLADIIIFFVEQNIELLKKAVQDFNKLK